MRRVLLVAGGLGLAAGVIATLAFPWSSRRELNVILITLDTTRSDRLGVYGYANGLTEEIDDVGQRGVVFERAYATVPLTLPSHTSMLTGLYPPEHGLRVNGTGCLSPTIPLLPEILKNQGYDTGAFLAAFVLDSKFGLGRGFDRYDDDLSHTRPAAHSSDRRRDGESVVDSALAWLRKRTTRQFFCWIHLYDAHDDYDPRPALFGSKFQEQPYDAGIAVESRQIGRVMAFLKQQHLDDSTIVVIAGDHGEGLGEHSETEHGMFVYNSTLQVPLIVLNKKFCRAGHRVAEAVSLVDLTPTLLDLLHIPAPPHVSGRSLRGALQGEPLPDRPCYAETESPLLDNRWCPQHAVIVDRWKYIHTTLPELYDLKQDPNETTNLIQVAEEKRGEMQNQLEELQSAFVVASAGNLKLSAGDLSKLQALGYVAGGHRPDGSASSARHVETTTDSLADMKEMLPHLVQISRARDLYHRGQPEEAISLVQTVLSATSQYPNAHILLGDIYRDTGRFDEAASAYREVLASHPDSLKAHAHLGAAFLMQGQFEQAADEFREVIQLDSEAPQAHFDLARALIQLKKPDEAIAEFHEAIRSDPGFLVAHFQLGVLLAYLGRLQDAARSFEAAIQFNPRFAMAHTNLASVQLQLGQTDRAREHARKAVIIEPASFEARFNLGAILITQKRYTEGIVEFREAQKIRPDDPRSAERILQAESALRQAGR